MPYVLTLRSYFFNPPFMKKSFSKVVLSKSFLYKHTKNHINYSIPSLGNINANPIEPQKVTFFDLRHIILQLYILLSVKR